MTEFGRIPAFVEENAAARLAAHRRNPPCSTDECTETAQHGAISVGGWWCPACWEPIRAARGIHVPTPDPTKTVDGLRAAAAARGDRS